MEQTAVETLIHIYYGNEGQLTIKDLKQALEMEKKETLKRQLFIGKVSEIIGFEKTLELWKETLNQIK